ncbi:MAG TPA: prolipoprotein diacylglyceryl transferase [Steroidobacteraceae bacterium]|nr:prolipoprotein diacylglyceryl transferase [Steroidobacteraceae bacterium]
MLTYPDIDPIAISLGPLKVRWYGLMYVLGFAAAWWLARRRAAQPSSTWRPADVDDLIFYSALGVILGGRLGWVLFYGTEEVIAEPLRLFRVWEGGMSFHGGLIGVLIAIAIFAMRRGRRIADVFDFTAPLPALGFLFGRIGNFINGELWGKPTDVPWAFIVDGVPLHPSQLYEAALEGFVLFVLLWWFTSTPRPRLAPSGLFLVGYGVFRFAVEFIRVPDANRGYLLFDWMTMGQILSTPMIVAGLILLVIAYRRNETSGNYKTAEAPPSGSVAKAAR